jgi:Ca2+-transporting ATPase
MQRPPRPAAESLFAHGSGTHIIWVGSLMATVTLVVQAVALNLGNVHWQTMVFTVLSFSQLGHVMAIRSEKVFLFRQGLFSNKPLIVSIIVTLILQLTVIYLPAANTLFKTQPLSLVELSLCVFAASIVFHAVEIEKWIKARKPAITSTH